MDAHLRAMTEDRKLSWRFLYLLANLVILKITAEVSVCDLHTNQIIQPPPTVPLSSGTGLMAKLKVASEMLFW